MLKTSKKNFVEVQDWDELVQKTYGRPYCFQQQNGCQGRGTHTLNVPEDWDDDENMNDSIPEKVNGEEMGVKFDVWLARDPKAPIKDGGTEWLDLFWERNFYPDIQKVANDLHAKGLLPAGEYVINIDW